MPAVELAPRFLDPGGGAEAHLAALPESEVEREPREAARAVAAELGGAARRH